MYPLFQYLTGALWFCANVYVLSHHQTDLSVCHSGIFEASEHVLSRRSNFLVNVWRFFNVKLCKRLSI